MNTEKKKTISIVILIMLLFAAVILLTYFLYKANYYRTHFLSGTIINSYNCSGCTVDEVEQALGRNAETYAITIYERDEKQEVICGSDIGYKYTPDGTVQRLLDEQNHLSWIGAYFLPFEYSTVTINTTFNETLLKESVNKLNCANEETMTAPKDAYVEYTTKKRYEVIPEVYGNTLDTEELYQTVKTAIENSEPAVTLETEKLYESPEIKSDSKKLNDYAKTLNSLTKAKITYDFGDRKEVLDRDILKEWLIINKKKTKIELDESKVAEYVAELSQKYDTYGKPRNFTCTDGEKVRIENGNYGWLINQEAEAEELLRLVKNGKKTKRTPEYTLTAISRKTNDIGKTYIEVDLTNQHLWYYIKGKLYFETDLVSGDVVRGRETPTGVYTIMYCQRNAVLVGPGYRCPVSYWMPFYNGCGLHDASWRWSFGSEIYQTNGSHGCLNLPLASAQTIFEKMEPGTPIVLYKCHKKDLAKQKKA